MLNETQKTRFDFRAKKEALSLLNSLNISVLTEQNVGVFLEALDVNVSGLVTVHECENKSIDEELLKIYDLLTDIVVDNEEDIEFLNQLFFANE